MSCLEICHIDCRWLGATTKPNRDRQGRRSDSTGCRSRRPHQTAPFLIALGTLDFEEYGSLQAGKGAHRRTRSVKVTKLSPAI